MADAPEFYTMEEGGRLRKWRPLIRGVVVHSLFFADGTVWDSSIGWATADIERVRASYERAQQRLSGADL